MPQTLRTRFAQDIVAEFLPPARATKRTKVIVICDGVPSVPKGPDLMRLFSKKGFWVFYPRYRGAWESDGVFLKRPPNEDVLDVVSGLSKGFTSLWDGKKFKLRPDEVHVLASSFGGPAGILASRDPRVTKVVAISPVVDWLAASKAEPMDFFLKFMRQAFGNGYRFGRKEEMKLRSGKFYSPVRHIKEIDGSKLLIFHAKDDESVRWNEVAKFAHASHAELRLFKKGGHLKSGYIIRRYWKQIAAFLSS